MKRILVTGAGGFIGNHLVTYLKNLGHWIRGVDIKYPEFNKTDADEFLKLDLRIKDTCSYVTTRIDEVYALAADMGGMGYIAFNDAQILHNNLLINIHTLDAAKNNGVEKYLFSSSACIYPLDLQLDSDIKGLKEDDAYPANPQDAYGWEKLITERLITHYDIDSRIVRFHNIFGPLGTWHGGREKVPAALCRKIAIAKLTNNPNIEIWGDGEQTRSFCYIDDCLKGLHKLMESNYNKPLNLGQDRMVTINELADIITKIAGIEIIKNYVDGPQGVRGRNSDNSRLKKVLNWQPEISLEEGLRYTYFWIEKQIKTNGLIEPESKMIK